MALQEASAADSMKMMGDRPVPEHPNPVKEKAIRKCGEHPARTTLWRFAGVDLT